MSEEELKEFQREWRIRIEHKLDELSELVSSLIQTRSRALGIIIGVQAVWGIAIVMAAKLIK